MHRVAVTEVQDPALGLVEHHPVGLSTAIQLTQMDLQGLPPSSRSTRPPDAAPSANLPRVQLNPLTRTIHQVRGTKPAAPCQPPAHLPACRQGSAPLEAAHAAAARSRSPLWAAPDRSAAPAPPP